MPGCRRESGGSSVIGTDGRLFGVTDVELFDNGETARMGAQPELIPLVDTQSLPVKFWLSPAAGSGSLEVTVQQCWEVLLMCPALGEESEAGSAGSEVSFADAEVAVTNKWSAMGQLRAHRVAYCDPAQFLGGA